MIVTFSRGRGFLVPLLFVLSVVAMIPSGDIGVRNCHLIMLGWLLACGAGVAGLGVRSLLQAPARLRRPMRAVEWIFDFGLSEPRPFHSFMFVQAPWWAIAYAVACYKIARTL